MRFLITLPFLAAGLLAVLTPASFAEGLRVAIIDSGASGYADQEINFTGTKVSADPLGHGTEIAKLIRKGNPEAQIFMLQVCEKKDGTWAPSQEAILKAIRWATDNGIHLVNMSLVTKYNREIEEAITQAATSHGIVFVAAAGNKTIRSQFAADSHGYVHRVSRNVTPAFPASNPFVIAVGGLDEHGQVASYSGSICDIFENGKILGQEGSSFACARVTSRIATLLNKHPELHSKDLILSYLK